MEYVSLAAMLTGMWNMHYWRFRNSLVTSNKAHSTQTDQQNGDSEETPIHPEQPLPTDEQSPEVAKAKERFTLYLSR